jgi:hypothetical protein
VEDMKERIGRFKKWYPKVVEKLKAKKGSRRHSLFVAPVGMLGPTNPTKGADEDWVLV